MFGPRLDDDTADRLLAGRVAPHDAPPGFEALAAAVMAAVAAPTAGELAGERDAVAAAVRMSGADAELRQLTTPGRPAVHARSFRLKVAGAIAGALVVASGGLAFAGALPAPAQDAVSTALSHVGISIPSSSDHPDGSGHPASTGSDISQTATTTDATGVDKGAEISGAASGGMSQAGQNGSASASASASPSVTLPTSGTGLGDTSSGGTADSGTGTADTSSGDRSASGSSNAAPSLP